MIHIRVHEIQYNADGIAEIESVHNMEHAPDTFTIYCKRDPSPKYEWVIEYFISIATINIWQCINNYPISFDVALRGLQALVNTNRIGLSLDFGQSVFYYRFPPNCTHYRIRNMRTDEGIYGDVLM